MKEKLISALQQKPYFLVLLPFFFIVHGYNEFFGFFTFKFLSFNFTITIFCTGVFYLLSSFYFKNPGKTALFTFWVLLIALLFGWVHDATKKIFSNGFFSSYTFILPLILLLVLVMLLYIKKNSSTFQKTILFLNLLQAVFFLYETVDIGINYQQLRKGNNLIDNRFTALKEYNPLKNIPDSLKPDIYFLVFDGMPSTKGMKAAWNYDNSLLDSFLLKEKFFISEDSKSNYNLTVLSVSSTLNMDYTPPIALYQDETKMYFKAAASILNNSLTKILQKEGYSISQYQSISFNNKDWKGTLFFKDMLYMNYFYKTLPGRIYRDLGWNLSKLKLKATNDFIFSRYEKRNKEAEKDLHTTIQLVNKSCVLKKPTPQFVYAHFQLPHDPFVFDSVGNRKPTGHTIHLTEKDQPKAFIEQVKFANSLINQLVTHIKVNNKKNTVILIEGDHGYRNIYGKQGYMIFDNLNAIYLPGNNYQFLYPSVSPVNSFRVVLNKFFSVNLPLLKDSSIFIPYTLPREK